MGENQLIVEIIDPQTQKPVAVENLDVNVSMPMEGEEEMTSMAKVEPDAQPGRYIKLIKEKHFILISFLSVNIKNNSIDLLLTVRYFL